MLRTLLLVPLFSVPALLAPAPAKTSAPVPVHCQVPCGIFADSMRIDMLMEDATTIEKAMKTVVELEKEGSGSHQLVRWIVTKEQHAQAIQDTVAAYWMAQRIKAPAGDDAEALARYHRQLVLLHGITVTAMKCKQTTDTSHVAKLRQLALDFSETYFAGEDLEHIRQHHSGEHR